MDVMHGAVINEWGIQMGGLETYTLWLVNQA